MDVARILPSILESRNFLKYIYIETSSLRINREVKLPLSTLLRVLMIYPFKLRLRFCSLNYLFAAMVHGFIVSKKFLCI